jgi:hypothetical protein
LSGLEASRYNFKVHLTVHRVLKGFLSAYLLAIHLLLLYFVGERILQSKWPDAPFANSTVTDPTEKTSIPIPPPVPQEFGNTEQMDPNSNTNTNVASAPPVATNATGLIIPVAGITANQLIDTFSAARA